MSMSWNSNISTVSGFSSLEECGVIGISWNAGLSNLSGFSNLNTVQSIYISNNEILTDFCGLEDVLQTNSEIEYSVLGNAYNPTIEQITSGNCSQ